MRDPTSFRSPKALNAIDKADESEANIDDSKPAEPPTTATAEDGKDATYHKEAQFKVCKMKFMNGAMLRPLMKPYTHCNHADIDSACVISPTMKVQPLIVNVLKLLSRSWDVCVISPILDWLISSEKCFQASLRTLAQS